MKPKTAVARAYKELRLQREDRPDGETCWWVFDADNDGQGVFGTEEDGQRHYEKSVMFRALARIDPEYDWHELDWHTLTGPAGERVDQMVEWRREQEEAAKEVEGYRALMHLARAAVSSSMRRK